MGPKSFSPQVMSRSPQADDILMKWEGCAFKSHVPEIFELPKGWKKLLTSHRTVLGIRSVCIKSGLESGTMMEKWLRCFNYFSQRKNSSLSPLHLVQYFPGTLGR